MTENPKRPSTILSRLLHSENLFNRLNNDRELMAEIGGLNPRQREATLAAYSVQAELEHSQDKNSQNH